MKYNTVGYTRHTNDLKPNKPKIEYTTNNIIIRDIEKQTEISYLLIGELDRELCGVE